MNFLTGLALARFLGLEGYGEYVLVYGAILFFSTLQMSLVLSPMMVKGAGIEESSRRKYFSSVLVQQLLFCVASGTSIIAGGFAVGMVVDFSRFERFLVPVALATSAFLMQDYYRRYFFLVKQPVAAIVNDIISYGVLFGLVLSFGIARNIDTGRALWFMALSFSVASLAAFLQTRRTMRLELGGRAYFAKILRENYHFGKWLLGVNVMYWGQGQVLNYFVAGLISVVVVGAINACMNVLGVLRIFYLGLNNILLPEASRAYKRKGMEGLRTYLGKVSFFGGALTLVIVLIAGVWNEYWLMLLYGNTYSGYGWIVIWWGVYFLVGFFHRPYVAGLSVLDRTKRVFQSMLIGFGLFIILSYPLTTLYQTLGIMTLMCVSNLVTLLLLGCFFKSEAKRLSA